MWTRNADGPDRSVVALFPETSWVFPRRKMLLAGKKHDPFKETPDAMVAQPQPGRRQPKSQ
jgi:hypothetical protein